LTGGPELTLSYSLSGTRGWKEVADDIRYRWNAAQTGTGDAASYTDRFRTVGRAGGGGIYHDNPLWRDIDTPTITNTAEVRWRKGLWSARAAGVASFSKYKYKDVANGFFNSTSVGDVGGLTVIGHTGVGAGSANPVPLTITFDDQTYWGPKTITATAASNYAVAGNSYAAGQPIEWWKNSVARIGGARSRPGTGKSIVTAAKLHVKRDFATENPLSLQLGFDIAEEFKSRTYPYHTWQFVGADGMPGTADDAATLIAANNLPARRDSAYDYPAIERISLSKLYDLYRTNPNWFRFDEARSARLSLTSNPDYELTETTLAPYLQFDWQLMRNRLRLTGGVRYEKNEAEARGLSINNSAAYQTYADGSIRRAADVVGPNGLPTTRSGAPVFLPGVTNGSLEHTALVYRAKGASAEGGNDNYFPSLHVNYSITDKIIWQAGYARTQAKNRFDRSVIPHNEIIENTVSGTNAQGRVNVRNKDLKPWTADNVETRLSYYTDTGGVFGVGVFRKQIQDYQLNLVGDPLTAADTADLAARFPDLGIGAEHIGYELATWRNVGSARIDGAEFEMRQSLDPLLRRIAGEWGRGFMVRSSAAYTNLKGQPAGGDFNQLRDKRYTVSLGYHRARFSGNIGYIMNGRQVNNGAVTSNGFTAEQVHLPDHMVDFNVTYSVTKWAQLFIAGSNITDERRKREEQYDERPEWSRMVQSNTYGITYTIGMTGRF
jgi:TonB-dependent receptor